METRFANKILIRYQKIFWLFCLIYFAAVSIILMAGSGIGDLLSFWGVFGVLVLTVGKLIIFAEQFRTAGQIRFALLSYGLILVIMATVALGFKMI